MAVKTIRVIAPLPPNGCKSAAQARDVIGHLVAAGHEVRPATALQPAYSPDLLHFSTKRVYEPDRLRLSAENPDALVLYPEGLGFGEIKQKLWKHRRLEEWRRIRLAWGALKGSGQAVVIFQPSQLWRPMHLVFVALALGLKIAAWRKICLRRQAGGAAAVVAPILGHRPEPISAEQADLANIRLAASQGGEGGVRLTPLWLRSAYDRLAPDSALAKDIAELIAIIEAFGEARLPAFQTAKGDAVRQAFKDRGERQDPQVPITGFMRHLRFERRLEAKFPLGNETNRRAYAKWYVDHAPETVGHALPLGAVPPRIQAGSSPKSRADALHRIKKYARFFGAAKSVEPSLRDWLVQEITPGAGGLSRLELLIAVLAYAPVKDMEALRSPWSSQELKRWLAGLVRGGYPMLAELARVSDAALPARISITGGPDSETGLGQNQKMSIEALAGIVPEKPVFLHHANADAIPRQMLMHHRDGAFHIGFLLWEMEEVPQSHRLAGEVLDEIWVPSRYVQRLYQAKFDRPVTWVGKGFDLPEIQPFDLSELGVSAGQSVFLTSFDMHSSVARKNPLAAVLAFQLAFEGRQDVRLIVKTTPMLKNHWGDPEQQLGIIQKIAAKDSRIILWQTYLPFAQFLGLISAVTALVSPHRAEGFGYLPAYAMKLGTPVISTDYSGTQDFCTDKTAFPVPWRKRNVRAGESIYPLNRAFWAEIDHEALAKTMQQVLLNQAERDARAKAGQKLMAREYTRAALRDRYKARLAALGLI